MTANNISEFYSSLRVSLRTPLPGVDAQLQLAIVGRRVFATTPHTAKQAAVCAVLYPSDNELRLAFIQRTTHDKDHHSGQISFPGGQVEPQDETIEDTAIRELLEETAIDISKSQVLGALTSLYIPVSNFEVHPFVIGLDEKPTVLKQESEVADIFGFDLNQLLDLSIKYKQISGSGFTIPSAPYFDLDGRTLWGATAMMTNELLEAIRSF